MRPAFTFVVLALAAGLVGSDQPSAKTHQVELDGHAFTLPAGFTIEVAAKSLLVDPPRPRRRSRGPLQLDCGVRYASSGGKTTCYDVLDATVQLQ